MATDPSENQSTLTRIFLSETDPQLIAEKIFPLIYDELRSMAGDKLAQFGSNISLQATELAHLAFLRLFDQQQVPWKHRGQFFRCMTLAMRHILIDHARKKSAGKRNAVVLTLGQDGVEAAGPSLDLDILALDEALERLEKLSLRQANIVELRYFAGLTLEEIAELLEISKKTVQRDWKVARLWLRRALEA